MPKRVYVGGSAAVEIQLPNGQVVTVARGSVVEVPDEMAKEMDASAAWEVPTSKSSKSEKEV